jgi:hypothetical protein
MFNRKFAKHPDIVIFIVVGILVFIGYLYQRKGVYVSITNNTQTFLKDVGVTYTGGTVRIKGLKPHESYGKRINPNGESHLELEWYESSGVKQSHTVDVYFEHNYRGSIEISIDPDNRVSWTDKTRLTLLF